MKRGSVLAVATLLAACGAPAKVEVPPATEPEAPIKSVTAMPDPLPGDGFLGAWSRKGKAKTFRGPNLYAHINGGAEVFLELGFDRLDVRGYVHGEDEVVLELYWMADAAAALGIYLMNCGQETEAPSLSARHTTNPYQLQLQKGTVYAKINNQSASEGASEALLAFARHVADHLDQPTPSNLFDSLPRAHRVANSERVIRGPFTLERVFTLGRGDVLQLEGKRTALAADYETEEQETYTLIQVDYTDEAEAVAAFLHLTNHLDPYLEVISKSQEDLTFKDYAGRFGKAAVQNKRITLKVNLPVPG
jgi:hypothetical protein